MRKAEKEKKTRFVYTVILNLLNDPIAIRRTEYAEPYATLEIEGSRKRRMRRKVIFPSQLVQTELCGSRKEAVEIAHVYLADQERKIRKELDLIFRLQRQLVLKKRKVKG